MRPLRGVRVLDLSQFLSGPRCGQILANLGADVVKIEPPSGDTMRLLLAATGSERGMHTIHAGKRGIMLDLHRPADQRLFLRLVRVADILIDNSAPGAMDKLGLGYDELAVRNPGLIYVSISGFGRTGPHADRVAFDIIAQATGGAMFANHQPERPPGVFFADLVSGAYAAIGALAALRTRERTGQGQLVDISMQDVIYFQNFWGFLDRTTEVDKGRMEGILGRPLTRLLNDENNPMCFWNSYATKDGHVVIVALTERQWQALAQATGLAELTASPLLADFVSRIKNSARGVEVIAPWVAAHTSDEVVATLAQARVPCGKVNDYDALKTDEQLAARGMLTHTTPGPDGPIAVPGNPIHLSAHPWEPPPPGPAINQHRAEILRDWLGEEEA